MLDPKYELRRIKNYPENCKDNDEFKVYRNSFLFPSIIFLI